MTHLNAESLKIRCPCPPVATTFHCRIIRKKSSFFSIFCSKCALFIGQIWWNFVWQYISGRPTKVPSFKFLVHYLLKLLIFKVLRTLFRGPDSFSKFVNLSHATIYTTMVITCGRISAYHVWFSQFRRYKFCRRYKFWGPYFEASKFFQIFLNPPTQQFKPLWSKRVVG